MRFYYLLIIFLVFPIVINAQNDTKIEKKLSKLYNSRKYTKCYNKALKLNKKYPKSEIPEYYFTKISIDQYSSANEDDPGRLKHLKKAVVYSNKLSDNYAQYKEDIRDSLKSYIYFIHDSQPDSRAFKTAFQFYSRKYSDTLSFAIAENIAEQVPSYDFSNSRIDSLRLALIIFAEKQDGIRYKYAGEKPETGFDCSGFTKYVYSHIGIEIPHNAQKQSILDGRNSSWEHHWKDRVLFVKTLPELEHQE